MRKTFKYRIFPTKAQTTRLLDQLDQCRSLYNHLLEQSKSAYEQQGESLSLYDQQATFVALKNQRPALGQVHSQMLQNVAVRLDLAMKAFFRSVKRMYSCSECKLVLDRDHNAALNILALGL
jgi:putative transposase